MLFYYKQHTGNSRSSIPHYQPGTAVDFSSLRSPMNKMALDCPNLHEGLDISVGPLAKDASIHDDTPDGPEPFQISVHDPKSATSSFYQKASNHNTMPNRPKSYQKPTPELSGAVGSPWLQGYNLSDLASGHNLEHTKTFSTTSAHSSITDARMSTFRSSIIAARNKERADTTRLRNSKLLEGDFYGLFVECMPTDERLEVLRDRWLDNNSLRYRLLYCRPFHIVFEEPESSSTKLSLKTHHELGELLHNGELESFTNQLSSAWPTSFGSLINDEGQARYFQWHLGAPQLDDGTVILCRKSVTGGSQQLLQALSDHMGVSLHPSDNTLWQILPTISNTILTMRTVAFLENLFAPTDDNFTSFGTISDWFPVQNSTPALHSTGDFGRGDWLCIQFKMRTCIPDQTGDRVKRFKNAWGISPKGIGFPLHRQAAKIPDITQSTVQFAVEFLLSVSIVLRKKRRLGAPCTLKYDVVVYFDYNTDFDERTGHGSIFPVLSDDLDLGLDDCGAGAEGFFQVLIVLTKTIDRWRKCWDVMMDKIDDIIGIQLQDTLDKERWTKLMYDDSLQLSEQYFTILQLLRIFQNWIRETEGGLQNLGKELIQQCELWQAWQQKHAPMDEVEWPLDVKTLRNNVGKINNFFRLRVTPLRERIERKKEEVASLQDALLNASSLREALKAKTLNLYIGVFTTVTVFFTPLGFIATLWTIPFLGSNSEISTPRGFAASFVTVPLLTYILSTVIIFYFWVRSSGTSQALALKYSWQVLNSFWRLTLSTVGQLVEMFHELSGRLIKTPNHQILPEVSVNRKNSMERSWNMMKRSWRSIYWAFSQLVRAFRDGYRGLNDMLHRRSRRNSTMV
ncbi:hypothetical protein HD806DRAFT_525493 [Xylariaceae sp. AK1471]|nr:hypothetical protein HD806DRAFT_525493 [Xylariaceae sp. AK1471]